MGSRLSDEETAALLAQASGVGSLAVDLPAPRLGIIRGEHPAIARVRNKKTAPKEWVDDLRSISPESLKIPYLQFHWHESAERWCLNVFIPDATIEGVALIPPEMRVMLAGRPWWELPPTAQEGRKHLVSAYQWEMYRKYRVWARPFWCIQGDGGGTPAIYTDLEKALLKAEGKDQSAMAPGSLPYAGWDERVKVAVQMRDRLLWAGMSMAVMMERGDTEALKAQQDEAEKAYRTAFWGWWEGTMAPQIDFLEWYTRQSESDMTLRPATDAEMNAGSQAKDMYIEHGNVPHTQIPS